MNISLTSFSPPRFGLKNNERIKTEESPVRLQVKTFAKCPRLSFQTVNVGSSNVIDFIIENPNDFSVTLSCLPLPADSEIEIAFENGKLSYESGDTLLKLEGYSKKFLKCKWSPTKSGNMRHTLYFEWDNGPKLKATFFGTAEDATVKQRKTWNLHKPKKISRQASKTMSLLSSQQRSEQILSPKKENLLQITQPETPSRRTTFTVNTSPTKRLTVVKENAGTVSPLNFDSTDCMVRQSQKENTSPRKLNNRLSTLPLDISKDESSVEKKKEHLKKDNRKFLTSQRTFVKSQRNLPAAEEKPKHSNFLKRQSITRPLPKKAVQGVAMKNLNLSKKSAVPRHPMPFAAKNMYYDERWIEKQERGFRNWLNFILTPEEENEDEEENDRRGTYTVDASRLQPVAPSREDISYKVYSLRRSMSRLRRAGCQSYHSEEFSTVVRKLEREIECGMLSVRPEKRIEADLGIKNAIIGMIMSYNSLWLRIGLEVIYGEIILLHSNNDTHNLSQFIMQRFLYDPVLAAKYAHSSVVNLYKKGYEEALHKFILKKFLLLVVYLDRVKSERLIEHDPCLFNKNSEYKSSRDLLLEFSREYLKGEGDITKHLSYMGIKVTHQQSSLGEYDFGVRNLSVDFRDGVKLVRIVELLTKDWTLSQKLRVPSVSRLQKVYNNSVALDRLRQNGLNIQIDSKQIVDGHREKTLLMLWQIIFHFQVGLLLDIEKLKQEVDYQKKNLAVKQAMSELEKKSHAAEEPMTDDQLYFKSERLSLLLQWCKLICAQYQVKIDNFTVSFSDGIALCCLLNFYHPDILPRSLINHETTVTRSVKHDEGEENEEDDFIYANWTKCFSPKTGINRTLETLLRNEAANFTVLNTAVQELGGVPSMIRAKDMSNTIPDEKVVITYVSYLCARLLSIREESQAARKIQLAWRNYLLKKIKRLRKIQDAAATKIQAWYRVYYRQKIQERKEWACTTIQKVWRKYKQRCKAEQKHNLKIQEKAAVKIQAFLRGSTVRLDFLFMRGCVIVCQSVIRGWLARRRVNRMHHAAYLIQQCYRGYLHMCWCRYIFLQQCASVVIIQRAYRDYRERKLQDQADHLLMHQAASDIQSTWKGFVQRRQYLQLRSAVVCLQALLRGKLQQQRFKALKYVVKKIEEFYLSCLLRQQAQSEYAELRRSAITIQHAWHNTRMQWKIRYDYLKMRSAVIHIQGWFRTVIERKNFLKIKYSVLAIEEFRIACLKMKKEKDVYLTKRKAAIAIQTHYRSHLLQERQNRAARLIQELWHGRKATLKAVEQLSLQKRASVKLQSTWRGYLACKQYCKVKRSVQVIENFYQAIALVRATQFNYRRKLHAIVCLQSAVRMYLERSQFKRKIAAAKTIQRCWRQYTEYCKQKQAATLIQCCYKGHRDRKMYARKQLAVLKIQTAYRMIVCKRKFQRKQQAAQKIQNVVKNFFLRKRVETNASLKISSFMKMVASRHRYKKLLCAVKAMQSRRRVIQAQNKYMKLKRSAIIVQSMCRMNTTRCDFKRKQQACIKIQSVVRMIAARAKYQQLLSVIVRLQSLYRKNRDRRSYREKQRAAVKLQSLLRGWKQRKQYSVQKHACILIQSTFKGYRNRRKAAIQIQSAFRGYAIRKDLSIQNFAAVLIQSHWKMFKMRRHFQAKVKSVRMIQNWYGKCKLKKLCHLRENSALKIQTWYRMTKAKEQFKTLTSQVVALQSFFRMMYHHNQYNNLRKAVIKIQSTFKMHQCQRNYSKNRNSAIIIQRSYRKYIKERKAATKIQSAFRMYLKRASFKKIVQACIVIQSTYKMHCERKEFLKIKHSSVKIQASYRMHVARTDFTRKKTASTLIKSTFKGYLARRQYLEIRSQVIKIQVAYRMHHLSSEYQAKKVAASRIQACFREYAERRKNRAATKIQSVWRMYVEKANLKAHVKACVKIQAVVKCWLQRLHYVKQQKVCIKLQALLRKNRASKIYALQKQSAVIIQTRFRGFVCRKEFERKVNSLKKLQSIARMFLKRTRFLKKKQACLKLQACVRMYHCRAEYRRMKNAVKMIEQFYMTKVERRRESSAMRIQSVIRMFIARTKYTRMTRSVKIIQTWWRDCKERCKQNKAAVKIQTAWRMYICRVAFQKDVQSVIKVQSLARMCQVRSKYIKQRQSAIKIQSALKMHISRKSFELVKCSVLKLQSTYRMHRQQKQFIAECRCVVKLQSVVRMFLAKKRYGKLKKAALVIQSAWRSHRKRVSAAKRNSAAVLLQSYVRMLQATRRYRQQQLTFIRIQRWWKGVSDRRHKMAVCVQSCWKMYSTRKMFVRKREAVVLIQRTVRRFFNEKEKTQACGKIQSWYRCVTLRREYLRKKQAAIIIQQHVRAYFIGYSVFMRYHYLRGALISIQAVCKGYLERRRYQKKLKGIVTLQSFGRMIVQRNRYLCLKTAVIVMQSKIRTFNAVNRYTKQKQACLILQKWWRNSSTKREKSVLLIETCWRRYIAQKTYSQKRNAALSIQRTVRRYFDGKKKNGACVKIQTWYRCVALRHDYLRKKQAAIFIQQHVRAYFVGYPLFMRYHYLRGALISIQTVCKGYLERKRYQQKLKSIFKMQSFGRMVVQRNQYLRLRKAAVNCQRIVRCCQEQKLLARKRNAAIKIQKTFRHMQLRGREMHQRRRENAAFKIQSFLKMTLHRKLFIQQKLSVCKLQSFVRMSIARSRYLELQRVTQSMQIIYRNNCEAQIQRKSYLQLRNCAILLQSHIRKHLVKKNVEKMNSSASLIQKCWSTYRKRKLAEERASLKISAFVKMVAARNTYQRKRAATTTVQSLWRMHAIQARYLQTKHAVSTIENWYRKQSTKRHRCASVIQRAFRHHLYRAGMFTNLHTLVEQRTAATVIGVWYLGCLECRHAREGFLAKRHAVVTLQRWYRATNERRKLQKEKEIATQVQRNLLLDNFTRASRLCLATLRVQRWSRGMAKRRVEREQARLNNAALKIQALWRGYKVRVSTSKRIREAARRISVANNNSTEPMKLCNRTRSALDYLLHVKNLSTVYEALTNLDVVTSLSSRCCEQLVTDNALSVIYRVLKYGNRSLPWISIKEVALRILLNVSKWVSTYSAVYREANSVEVILELMSNFRDKKTKIFPMACNLLNVLCQDELLKQDFASHNKWLEKITSFYRLTARKKMLDDKRNKVTKPTAAEASTWHRRASSIGSSDPLVAVKMLANTLELTV